MPDVVLKSILKQVSDYFDPTTIEERMVYSKNGSSDKIRWGLTANDGENREYLKVIAHPKDHVHSDPTSLRYIYTLSVSIIYFFHA